MALRDAMWLENAGAVYNAGDYRRFLEGVFSSAGVVRTGDLQVTQQSPVAMGVAIARGTGVVLGTENTNQGYYLGINDAAVNLSLDAAHSTLARIDLIVLRIRDDEYSGAAHSVVFEKVTGTAASSPVAPAVPANSLVIAQVSVAAAAASITNANILDRRTIAAGPWGTAWGRVGGVALVAVAGAGGVSVTDVPGFAATFVAINGRRYRVTAHTFTRPASGATGITDQSVYVLDGGGAQVAWSTVNSGAANAPHRAFRDNLVYAGGTNVAGTVAGSFTMKVAIARTGGSGNIETFSTTDLPSQLWIDDIGPA